MASNSTYNNILRNLSASAYAPADDGESVYTLGESGGKLLRKVWTKSGIAENKVVRENVRANTPAAYLVWGSNTDKRLSRQVRPTHSALVHP
jgi:phage gp37-like protein